VLSKTLAVLMIAAATAVCAAEPPPGVPTTLAGVDVTARPRGPAPPMRAVRAFVSSMSVMSTGEQLAIWSKSALPGSIGQAALGNVSRAASGETICPAVFGLPPDYAAFIVARMRQLGLETGAPVSQKDCDASDVNVIIAFPTDAADFIHELADKIPHAFGFEYLGALARDLGKPVKPIRAWYATQVIDVDPRASRLSPQYRSLIAHVLIIVDAKQTDALNMGQLSDYIAMTTLAELKPDSVPADSPTILNVFADTAAGRTPADGVTRLDIAYLKALYAINPRQVGVLQKDQIADRIRRDLAGR
jgi:hypothetical protein